MSHPFLLKNLQMSTVVSESGGIPEKRRGQKECDQASDDEQWGLEGAGLSPGRQWDPWGTSSSRWGS